ncbi:minichromosome maintenance protein MCM [Halorubrum sp. CSM-61]|uniref:minichromosome maintenance protein MCM n=1 Tax=Halorubrum sp. CSM-61 TaxID=2485838 RepID=UPI000F4C2BA7|nr:minichromosome maintenance protein MCM [Halorubrum sp. CSM-61]
MVNEEQMKSAFNALYTGAYEGDSQEAEQSDGNVSIRIQWSDLEAVDEEVAQYTLKKPSAVKECAEDVLSNSIQKIESNLHVRFHDLPDSRSLRVSDLRASHLGELVSISGKVVDAEKVQPFLKKGAFNCQRCGTLTYLPQTYGDIREPVECPGCETSGPFGVIQRHSDIIDFKCVILKTTNTNLEDPPVLPIYLLHDLVETVGEGDEVSVAGSYNIHPMSRQKETELNTYVEAVDIEVEEYAEVDSVNAEDLTAYIYEGVNKMMETETSFGASRDDVVEWIGEKYGVRETEIENRIDELVDEDGEDLSQQAGQLIK